MENLDCVSRAFSEESFRVYEPLLHFYPSSQMQENSANYRGPFPLKKLVFFLFFLFLDSNRILLAKIYFVKLANWSMNRNSVLLSTL